MYHKILVRFVENAYGKKSEVSYTYYTTIPKENLKEGMLLVAPTRNIFNTAIYEGPAPEGSREATRVITQIVDQVGNEIAQENLADYARRLKEQQEILEKLERIRLEVARRKVYEDLAKDSPEAKILLDKLDSLRL